MDYEEWNKKLGGYFFNQENAYKEVMLYVNKDTINKIGPYDTDNLQDFLSAVKAGPRGSTRSGLCQKAKQVYDNWRKERILDFPPYIAYLAFFVLAAGEDGDFAPNAYYPRFWSIIGDSVHSGTPPSFWQMEDLWEDLEKWTIEDKGEELGRFVRRIRGKWKHVGLPLSQTLCSTEELTKLPKLFEKAYLDPTDPPSHEVMTAILRSLGDLVFKGRTIRIITGNSEETKVYIDAITNLAIEELENWDGIVENSINPEKTLKKNSRKEFVSGLRICIRLDLTSQAVYTYLRFKTNHDFPEDGLSFSGISEGVVLTCNESTNGWSTSLVKVEEKSSVKLNAKELDWEKGERLYDEENGWKANLRPANTRVFGEGIDNLKDWVEVQHVERGVEYLITSRGDDANRISEWGKEGADSFKELYYTGLPDGWRLFKCSNILRSCPKVELITISSLSKLKLTGGIRSKRSATYFDFSPPSVIIQNSTGKEEVFFNDIPAKKSPNKIVWDIPGELICNGTIRITAVLDDEVIGRKTIRLESFDRLPVEFDKPCRNSTGEIIEDGEDRQYTRGVLIEGVEDGRAYHKILPFHLSDRIILIGKSPDQVIDWPNEIYSAQWDPVWALIRTGRKNWEAQYCGNSLHDAKICIQELANYKKQSTKKWKEALFYNRKKTKEPELEVLATLWHEYVEVARDV